MAVTTWTLTGDIASLVGDDWPVTGTAAAEAYLTASNADGPVTYYSDAGSKVLFGPTIPITLGADGTFTRAGIPDSSETGFSYTFTLTYRPTGYGRDRTVTTSAFTLDANKALDAVGFTNPALSDAVVLNNATDAVVSVLVADESSLTNVALEAEIAEGVAVHEADTSGAHAASAIAFTPTGTIAATDAQTAIAEVATDAATIARQYGQHVRSGWAVGYGVTTVTQAATAGTLFFRPIRIAKGGTVTAARINVTSLAGGSVVRLGIYAHDPTTGLPAALLADWGTVDTTGTGVKTLVISQALADDTTYWLALAGQGGSPTLSATDETDPMLPVAPNANGGVATLYATGVTGALPDPAPTSLTHFYKVPNVALSAP